MGWLIAYDIVEQKRWRDVHALVRAHGYRLQYSLFWADIDHAAARRLADGLRPLVDPRQDDVRLYHFPDRAEAWLLGAPLWPEGVGHAAARRFARSRARD